SEGRDDLLLPRFARKAIGRRSQNERRECVAERTLAAEMMTAAHESITPTVFVEAALDVDVDSSHGVDRLEEIVSLDLHVRVHRLPENSFDRVGSEAGSLAGITG